MGPSNIHSSLLLAIPIAPECLKFDSLALDFQELSGSRFHLPKIRLKMLDIGAKAQTKPFFGL